VKRSFSRRQKLVIINGVLTIVAIIVALQLWLLSATMNAFLGGEESVIIPAAIASVICLLMNAGLLWHIREMEQR
jgi:F0F1-type ATP synthase assembly protein I